MSQSTAFNIVFAGGTCGITMVRVGEELANRCKVENIPVKIKYVDLWVSDYLLPNTDLVIEMFPYFKEIDIPVINGRPFLSHQQEEQMYTEVMNRIREIQA